MDTFRHFNQGFKAAVIFVIFSISTVANAKDPDNFQSLMKIMGEKYSNVVLGILEEDYAKIIKNADIIANHPEPPLSLRFRIIAKLGTDFPDFKAWDDKVHIASVALVKAAEQKDDAAILKHNADVIKHCTGCHKAYRPLIRTLRE